MKSKLFKTILPAFALIIAISASLAFTPVESSMEDVDLTNMTWYQSPDEDNCIPVTFVTCDRDFTVHGLCCITVIIPNENPIVLRLYDKNSEGKCNVTLWRPNPS